MKLQSLARHFRAPKRLSDDEMYAAISKLPPGHPVHRPIPVPSYAGGRIGLVMSDGSPMPGAPAVPAGQKPYLTAPQAVLDEAIAGLPAEEPTPTFTPTPAPVLPPNAQVREPGLFERTVTGLRDLDWAALEIARGQGVTYATARQARGRTPVHDQILLAGRPPQERPRRAEAAGRRIGALVYPPCNGSGTAAAYAEVLSRVSAITGTTATARFPLPAIGGAA